MTKEDKWSHGNSIFKIQSCTALFGEKSPNYKLYTFFATTATTITIIITTTKTVTTTNNNTTSTPFVNDFYFLLMDFYFWLKIRHVPMVAKNGSKARKISISAFPE